MSDLRQAAQQALDALENDAMQRTFAGGVRISNATIALRTALAAPQQVAQADPLGDGGYPPLPNFDDEPIWKAIFRWQNATPVEDAMRRAADVERTIIEQLRAYVDADRAARAIEAEAREQVEPLIRQMLEALETCDETDGYQGPYQHHDGKAVEAAITAARAWLNENGGQHGAE